MRALPLRLLLLVGGISAVAVASPATAFAQHHQAHVAATGGIRAYDGRLADEYQFGYLGGVEAGYQPLARIGLQWTVLFGYFKASDTQNVNDWLAMTEMGFAVTVRVLEANAWSVCLNGGVNIVRADAPVPPIDERTFFGPSAALAAQYAEGELYIAASFTYGLINDVPSGLTILLSVGVGSR